MRARSLLIPAAALVLLWSASTAGLFARTGAAQAQGASAGELLRDSGRVFDQPQRSAQTVRARAVTVDLAALRRALPAELGGANASLAVRLFEDAGGTAVLASAHATPGGFVWMGRFSGQSNDWLTLAVQGDTLVGSAVIGDAAYTIRNTVVEQIDLARLPREAEPLTGAAPGPTAPYDPGAEADDGSEIDVLVVYTPSARVQQGGTAAIEALIQLGVAETNQAYAYSGAIQRLRLVHMEEVAYTESGAMGTDLGRLRVPGDGYLDAVHALRETHKADLVHLIADSPDFCGIAYRMASVDSGFADWAFGVTHVTCVSPNYSFGHELGHNMGLHHDLYVTGSDTLPFPYSRGYVNQAAFGSSDPDRRWRDVMAYSNQCVDNGFNCPKRLYFSTPLGAIGGDIAGNASTADGVRTLNETRTVVANFRTNDAPSEPGAFSKSLPANGATGVSTNPTLSWGTSAGATSYEVCATTVSTCSTWTNLGNTTSAVFISPLNPGVTYYWHVRSVNGVGTTYANGSASAVWSFTTGVPVPPGSFGKSSPASGATGQSKFPTLNWGASSGATSYQYCIDTTNNSACDGTWTSTGTSTSVGISGLSAETAHYWHVRAINGGGTTYANGGPTAFWSFTTAPVAGTLALSTSVLNFAGVNTSGTLNPITGAQGVVVTTSHPGIGWTATANQPWVQITGGAGTGGGTFTVGIINPGNILNAVTNATATVTMLAPGASNEPQVLTVHLTLKDAAQLQAPFGIFDTPLHNATVQGSMAVTGWALDDVGSIGSRSGAT